MRIKGLTRMFRGLPASTRTTPDASIHQSADPFPQSDRLSAFFAQWVCSLASTPPHVAASPPPNGGNGVIRTTTRRQPASNAAKPPPQPTSCAALHPRPAQGELFRARTHIRPSRATNVAHRTQKHSDDETNNTTAHPQHGAAETDDTFAPEKRTKNAHFSPAKAIAVSNPHRHKQAKAIAVSNHRATSPATPRRSARGRLLAATPMGGDDTAAGQISHVIYRGHFSRHPKNVAMPTMQIQCLNER